MYASDGDGVEAVLTELDRFLLPLGDQQRARGVGEDSRVEQPGYVELADRMFPLAIALAVGHGAVELKAHEAASELEAHAGAGVPAEDLLDEPRRSGQDALDSRGLSGDA
jgi:hypothetical protein